MNVAAPLLMSVDYDWLRCVVMRINTLLYRQIGLVLPKFLQETQIFDYIFQSRQRISFASECRSISASVYVVSQRIAFTTPYTILNRLVHGQPVFLKLSWVTYAKSASNYVLFFSFAPGAASEIY